MNLHAIEQMQLWGRRLVDGMGRPEFDFPHRFSQSQQSQRLSPPVAAFNNYSLYDFVSFACLWSRRVRADRRFRQATTSGCDCGKGGRGS